MKQDNFFNEEKNILENDITNKNSGISAKRKEIQDLYNKLEETKMKLFTDKVTLTKTLNLNSPQHDTFIQKYDKNNSINKEKKTEINKSYIDKLTKIRDNISNNTTQNNESNFDSIEKSMIDTKRKQKIEQTNNDINILKNEQNINSNNGQGINVIQQQQIQEEKQKQEFNEQNHLDNHDGDNNENKKLNEEENINNRNDNNNNNPNGAHQDTLEELLNKTPETRYRNSLNINYPSQSFDLAKEITYANKSFENKSMLNLKDINTSRSHENYRQLRFYQRSYEIKQAWESLEHQIMDNIKKQSNSKKMSETSYKLMIKKLENTLQTILVDIDLQRIGKLTFEQLGRMLTMLDIFKIIRYDENNKLINENLLSKQNIDQKQGYREMLIHEQLWTILSNRDDTIEYIDAELTLIFLRIILDPAHITIEELANILESHVEKYKQSQGIISNNQDDDLREENETEYINIIFAIEYWSILKFVKEFKKLNENRLAYEKIGYLKPDQFEEMKKMNDEFTFKPKIPKNSEILGNQNLEKFLIQHPLNELESPNQTKRTNHHHINNIGGSGSGGHNSSRNLSLYEGKKDKSTISQNTRTNIGQPAENESIINKSSSKINVVIDVLMKKEEIKKKKIEEMQKLKEIENFKECTFHPQVLKFKSKTPRGDSLKLPERLYNQHKVKLKKEEEIQMEKIERQARLLEACTFKPEINMKNSAYQEVKLIPKGYEKSIGRLRYALDENRKKKEALEKIPKGENYEKIRTSNIKPFTFVTKEKKHKKPPFVYVDVNVGPGRTGRIGIHEDDNPKILAQNFAIAFQLTNEMQIALEDHLLTHINDYYSKNDYR